MTTININHTMLGQSVTDGDAAHGTVSDTTFNLNLSGITQADLDRMARQHTFISGGAGYDVNNNGTDTLVISGAAITGARVHYFMDQMSTLTLHTADGREIVTELDGIDRLRLPGGIDVNLADIRQHQSAAYYGQGVQLIHNR